MKTIEALKHTEDSLLSQLKAKRSLIDDKTGKGSATEEIVERLLLRPHLPQRFQCNKGAVVEAANPSTQSGAIDRVIYDDSASPLAFEQAHSIFPIEAVAGLVEITLDLDATKLREDINRLAPVKAMLKRRILRPVPGSSTQTKAEIVEWLSPRSFLVGVPSDPNWQSTTIAQSLRKIQQDLGGSTHVHGLYVIGIGYFETVPIEPGESPYRVRGTAGPDRLFRFTSGFRLAFDRWRSLPEGVAADLRSYVPGDLDILAE